MYISDYYTSDPDHETSRWSVHDDCCREVWGDTVSEVEGGAWFAPSWPSCQRAV